MAQKFESRNIPSFPEHEQNIPYKTKKPGPKNKRRGLKIVSFFAVILLVAALTIGTRVIASSSNLLSSFGERSMLIKIKHLVFPPDNIIEGEKQDMVNILLLGNAGVGYNGELLTDTIILVSIRPSTKQVALISIPRDLLVRVTGYGSRKINSAYALGVIDPNTTGGELLKQTVSQTFDVPINFFARIDIEGAVKAIDALGGITVDVEERLVDPLFPLDGTIKYRTVIFEPGRQKMDGQTAIDFARSRQTTSDFSRSARQQKILEAVRNRLYEFNTISKTIRIEKLMNIVGDHFETDIEPWELMRFLELVQEINYKTIIHKVIDDSQDGPLEDKILENGAFVLVTKNKEKNELHEIVINVFKNNEVVQDGARIVILNGTTSPRLARTIANVLTAKNFTIVETGNFTEQNYETTLIYDISLGKKNTTLSALRDALGADIGQFIPNDLLARKQDADIVVIIGEDKIPQNSEFEPIKESEKDI